MWQAEHRLYLYPDDMDLIVDASQLSGALTDLKFIGQNLGENRYATGDAFVSLLTFMGCSPNIELEPQSDSPHCYIEIHEGNKADFISGKNTKFAICQHCKTPITNPIGNEMKCATCDTWFDSKQLNWRKSAFIASSWICIGNIYEHEAIPGDQLLSMLEEVGGDSWKPAYIRLAQLSNE